MNKFVEQYAHAFRTTGTTKLTQQYQNFYAEMMMGVDVGSVLEIGVYLGQSLKAWRMIWPQALIEGVDLDRRYDPSLEEEFKIYNFDSQVTDKVNKNISRHYDVVIDDGLHNWRSQLMTFDNFQKFTNKYYVIEDICGEYSLEKITRKLPKAVLDRSTTFRALGPTRDFIHDGLLEKRGQYHIMFIDMEQGE